MTFALVGIPFQFKKKKFIIKYYIEKVASNLCIAVLNTIIRISSSNGDNARGMTACNTAFSYKTVKFKMMRVLGFGSK